jgi:hypothetical protein
MCSTTRSGAADRRSIGSRCVAALQADFIDARRALSTLHSEARQERVA